MLVERLNDDLHSVLDRLSYTPRTSAPGGDLAEREAAVLALWSLGYIHLEREGDGVYTHWAVTLAPPGVQYVSRWGNGSGLGGLR